jgi:predicted ATPase
MKLRDFLADSVRYFGCQFVIATHSPILLSLEGARIYDLDADPVEVRPWTEIDNVRRYFEFFEDHRDEFQ